MTNPSSPLGGTSLELHQQRQPTVFAVDPTGEEKKKRLDLTRARVVDTRPEVKQIEEARDRLAQASRRSVSVHLDMDGWRASLSDPHDPPLDDVSHVHDLDWYASMPDAAPSPFAAIRLWALWTLTHALPSRVDGDKLRALARDLEGR